MVAPGGSVTAFHVSAGLSLPLALPEKFDGVVGWKQAVTGAPWSSISHILSVCSLEMEVKLLLHRGL